MEQRRTEEMDVEYHQVRRGWCLGDEEFRQELLARAGARVGPSHYSADRVERDEQKAQRLVSEAMKRMGWAEEELSRRPKGDRQKVKMARKLRQETTMTLKWIAQRLQMGTWTYVSNLLHEKSES